MLIMRLLLQVYFYGSSMQNSKKLISMQILMLHK